MSIFNFSKKVLEKKEKFGSKCLETFFGTFFKINGFYIHYVVYLKDLYFIKYYHYKNNIIIIKMIVFYKIILLYFIKNEK
jgi:hypothetical protein